MEHLVARKIKILGWRNHILSNGVFMTPLTWPSQGALLHEVGATLALMLDFISRGLIILNKFWLYYLIE